jgi:hypothetical protein
MSKIIKVKCNHCGGDYSSTELLESVAAEEDEYCPHCLKIVRMAGHKEYTKSKGGAK